MRLMSILALALVFCVGCANSSSSVRQSSATAPAMSGLPKGATVHVHFFKARETEGPVEFIAVWEPMGNSGLRVTQSFEQFFPTNAEPGTYYVAEKALESGKTTCWLRKVEFSYDE